jgi:hypothetical protein
MKNSKIYKNKKLLKINGQEIFQKTVRKQSNRGRKLNKF